jgi:hypothetical protein
MRVKVVITIIVKLTEKKVKKNASRQLQRETLQHEL